MSEEPTVDPLTLTGPLDENGHYAARQLADGRWLCVEPMTFQRARIGISASPGTTAREALDRGFGYSDVWEYDSRAAAILAMNEWDGRGEPLGWMRHPGGDRVRNGSLE